MTVADQQKFMRRAIALSREKMQKNCGGPFGAVIVKNGKVIGEGWNQVTSGNDPTAHAEVTAIRAACKKIKNFSLKGCDIYTSCEPCPMCLAAIYWARLERIYYANTRKDAAAIGFDDDFLYQEVARPHERRSVPVKRILPDEALAVFDGWRKKADKKHY
jgi:tRNA(Arg) A34 adenosine deaminase TadA